ncbi:membrane protein [Paenibacillus darwinianus]|uniref:Membrane protein n=1 Tax=Paenibacillus darwinianus TaxID=1380763 RepID=A0A9W5W8C7_9BACL|nr:TerC family protein [Paenibacillus darwinianus]EXX91882.1 membrane protein [Paenibacillus darwinianus]EXX92375.1 membrane protein [Paenibacillus darwinianus]EXX92725.1 membrane protein [Paenibacillus darwinianus]
MDLFSPEFWTALVTIIFIDLVLAGDNAIVIGLAARNLPKDQQKSAILWGTAGAVGIRIIATVLVVYLLNVPWLMLVGGLLLLWIAYKLLVQQEGDHDIKAGNTLWQSVQTIIIADAAMGIDNVIAVAGAAHGDLTLVILGLLISIPVVVWGSTLFIKLINRFSWIIYLGSAVLAYTAAKMIASEKQLASVFENGVLKYSFEFLMIIVILAAGYWTNKARAKRQVQQISRESH